MKHPFEVLRPEYEELLASMMVDHDRVHEIGFVAQKLIADNRMPIYQRESAATGVPAALLAALDERESGANLSRALGQGDRWDQVSTHVPKGHGPFTSKVEADIHYIRYDHLDDNSAPWSWPYVCWKGEAWNGFGPRGKGIHTGYLWAGTNHYSRGKYVADGKWDAAFVDKQLGIIPVMKRIIEYRPDLAFDQFPGGLPMPVKPQITPEGIGASHLGDVAWAQDALNKVLGDHLDAPLLIDGNYGRRTRFAVRKFQELHPPLAMDGLYGPETDAALAQALSDYDKQQLGLKGKLP